MARSRPIQATGEATSSLEAIPGKSSQVPYKSAVRKNGSVRESNPPTALFTPSTGFEDQGQHQLCRHSQPDILGRGFRPVQAGARLHPNRPDIRIQY